MDSARLSIFLAWGTRFVTKSKSRQGKVRPTLHNLWTASTPYLAKRGCHTSSASRLERQPLNKELVLHSIEGIIAQILLRDRVQVVLGRMWPESHIKEHIDDDRTCQH